MLAEVLKAFLCPMGSLRRPKYKFKMHTVVFLKLRIFMIDSSNSLRVWYSPRAEICTGTTFLKVSKLSQNSESEAEASGHACKEPDLCYRGVTVPLSPLILRRAKKASGIAWLVTL